MQRTPGTVDVVEREEAVYVGGRSSRGLADPAPMLPSMRRRRAFTLLVLTLLVPGSAQLTAGNRRLGRFGARTWLTLLAAVLLLVVIGLVSRSTALGILSRPSVLMVLQWVLAGWGVLWGVLFVDAWRLGRPGELRMATRRWLTGITALLLVLTTGSLVWGSSTVGSARSTLSTVFAGTTTADAAAGRYNVLLLGGDSGADRVGLRPDTIQLVSIDGTTGKSAMFGFARDTENIDFRPGSVMHGLMPEGWNCGDECLLNGIYTWATDHAKEFPAGTQDPGVLATKEAVEALSGLDIQYYAMVDLRGFADLVNAVGGLDINVAQRVPIGGGHSRVSGYIEPGKQHLDGYHALWYARSREGSTNYARMARQRCVITAMSQQLDPASLVTRFDDIAGASKGLLRTDIPASELGHFADLAVKARSQKITSVNFVPPLIKPWDYDADFVRKAVATTVAGKPLPKAPGTAIKGDAQGAEAAEAESGAEAPVEQAARTPSPSTTPADATHDGAAADDSVVECSAG